MPARDPGILSIGAPPPAEFARTQAELVAFRAGNDRVFDDLWRRYRGAVEVLVVRKVRTYAESAVRARLDAELEDILQDAALTIFAKLRDFEYRGPGSLLAWMAQIAAHVISDRADYWRAGKRRLALEQRLEGVASSLGGTTAAVPCSVLQQRGPGPATEHEQREARRAVAAALAVLSERDHTIVLWRFFGGASWAEIAAEVGAPSGGAVRKEWCERVLPRFATQLARSEPPGVG